MMQHYYGVYASATARRPVISSRSEETNMFTLVQDPYIQIYIRYLYDCIVPGETGMAQTRARHRQTVIDLFNEKKCFFYVVCV